MPTLQDALRDAGLSDLQNRTRSGVHTQGSQALAHVSPPWAPASTMGRVQHAARYEPRPVNWDHHATDWTEFGGRVLVSAYDPYKALARAILTAQGKRPINVHPDIAVGQVGDTRTCPSCHLAIAPAFASCPDC